MPNVTEILCAIERKAERAIVQELRLMTQEILAMRTQLSLEDRAHADALLMKLDHLERCQRVDTTAPATVLLDNMQSTPKFGTLPFDTLVPLEPSHHLVHFYSHDVGDLERVVLTETLAAAAQLVRQHLNEQPREICQVTHDANDGELVFLAGDDMVLASILPCEPNVPEVETNVTEACAALVCGDLSALQHLFVTAGAQRPERLVA